MTGAQDTEFVTADQPMSTGMQPAMPPHTMFCEVRRLRHHRVDDDVEEERAERQPADSQLTRTRTRRVETTASAKAKTRHSRGDDHAGDQRALRRAVHQRVDVAVDVHVERVGAAGGQVAADAGREDQPQVRHALRRPGTSPAPW